jgi:hypothetical protein
MEANDNEGNGKSLDVIVTRKVRKLPLKSHNNNLTMTEPTDYKPLQLPDGTRVFYATTPSQCSSYAKEILRLSEGRFSVWGFDAEWTVEFKKNQSQRKVALIQMYREKNVILFHLAASGLQEELVKVLNHERVFKIGLNITGDVKKLMRDFDVSCRGVVDLRQLSAALKLNVGPSLADMTEKLLSKNLPKPTNIRCGNWDKIPLPADARAYAALDAFASFEAMRAMIQLHMSKSIGPTAVDFVLDLLCSLADKSPTLTEEQRVALVNK